jgi:hypothetical protein
MTITDVFVFLLLLFFVFFREIYTPRYIEWLKFVPVSYLFLVSAALVALLRLLVFTVKQIKNLLGSRDKWKLQ